MRRRTLVVAGDFTTPQGAILCLEDAYRAKDIEAAVRCKDFATEAWLIFEKLKRAPVERSDWQRVEQLAEVLESAFRKHVADNGFADMTGVESSFPHVEQVADGIVIVTEECRYPDGRTTRQRLLVAQSEESWRVLNPVD